MEQSRQERKKTVAIREVPTLRKLALRTIIRYIHALSEVGDIPDMFLDEIFPMCSVDDLKRIEDANPDRKFNTNEIWKKHYSKTSKYGFYKEPEPSSVESWRKAYEDKEGAKLHYFEMKKKSRIAEVKPEKPEAILCTTRYITKTPFNTLLQNPKLVHTTQGKKALFSHYNKSRVQYIEIMEIPEPKRPRTEVNPSRLTVAAKKR